METLKLFPDNYFDSIVTDPPYGLSFMGKKWDYDVPTIELWKECYRVLKPGGYLLSFAGTRTQHRMACNIEDAGFEIRDMIAWIYGSGFPKSLNIGKAVDKLLGNEREEVGRTERGNAPSMLGKSDPNSPNYDGTTFGVGTTIHTKGTSEWEGYGTALKPALEPITVARKPLSEKSVALNVLKWGTGGINIDGCRVGTEDNTGRPSGVDPGMWSGKKQMVSESHSQGRFPANLIHDGSDDVVGLFPDTKSGGAQNGSKIKTTASIWHAGNEMEMDGAFYDSGNASRFFYCAKSSKQDRNEGCEGLEDKKGIRINAPRKNEEIKTPTRANNHPTVKPTNLMRYLVRLVTPKGGICLDPFGGSGSTGKACVLEGFDYVLCEMEEDFVEIAEARIEYVKNREIEIEYKSQLTLKF